MAKVSKKSAQKRENYARCAELLKLMSNPKRLEIMDMIKDKEVTVNEISAVLGTRKSNTSQHLAYLRYVGIVTAKRSGKNIFYKLKDPRIIEPFKALNQIKIKSLLS